MIRVKKVLYCQICNTYFRQKFKSSQRETEEWKIINGAQVQRNYISKKEYFHNHILLSLRIRTQFTQISVGQQKILPFLMDPFAGEGRR